MRQFLLTNLVEVDGRFVWRLNLDALAQHLDKILDFRTTRNLLWANPLPPGWKLSVPAVSRLGGRDGHTRLTQPLNLPWGGLGVE